MTFVTTKTVATPLDPLLKPKLHFVKQSAEYWTHLARRFPKITSKNNSMIFKFYFKPMK